jgi:hypothetical protein
MWTITVNDTHVVEDKSFPKIVPKLNDVLIKHNLPICTHACLYNIVFAMRKGFTVDQIRKSYGEKTAILSQHLTFERTHTIRQIHTTSISMTSTIQVA